MNILQRLFYLKVQEVSERGFRKKQEFAYIQMEIASNHFENRKRHSILSNCRYLKRSGTIGCIKKLYREMTARKQGTDNSKRRGSQTYKEILKYAIMS
jgi:hypothetical protein